MTRNDLLQALSACLPAVRIITDPLRTLAYGVDASFYRLIPQAVVIVETEEEVRQVMAVCRAHRAPFTFRAAGTSLSGQALTDSVLIVLGDGWGQVRIEDEGRRVRLGPGVIGAEANRQLAPLGRKIGPDPASINAAKVGGIAANNASGMCCGTAHNSYRTLAGLRLILADGTLLDTNEAESVAAFRHSHAGLLEGLALIAAEVQADSTLRDRIARKYKLKNTTGYSLNALIDFTDPLDILAHLMIGSEGTLGFLAEIRYNTVPEPRHKATALALFADIGAACEAVALLKPLAVDAVELIDRAGLRAVTGKEGVPESLATLGPGATALLIEVRAEDPAGLGAKIEAADQALARLPLLSPLSFSTDPEACARLWTIRKGLFPSVGAMRRVGTTVLIEDVAFPVPRLAEATVRLQEILAAHGYGGEAIIFGHALEGNLHFVFPQDFNDPAEVQRYADMMDAVCIMVVEEFDGALKAEHGTGRNMAPYVELEWRAQALDLMTRIKALFDPDGLVNPGVILNEDPHIHLKNLKPMPAADPLVDRCIECGFCEPRCPSHGLTLSPRQRIVGWREITRLEKTGEDAPKLAEIRRLYDHHGIETCAACGLCSTACPVGIETGLLMKSLRGRRAGAAKRAVAGLAAHAYGPLLALARLGLGGARIAHRVLGAGLLRRLPGWTPALPGAARLRLVGDEATGDGPAVVYFPSCASRTMGPSAQEDSAEALPDVMARLLRRAGYRVILPRRLGGLCCGMPFESKGLQGIADAKSAALEAALRAASDNGRLPILFDTSPCALRMRRFLGQRLPLVDPATFLRDAVLPRLTIHRRQPGPVALHATCSDRHLGSVQALRTVAEACAETVITPPGVECCGFAGDKGFTTPELNRHATRKLPEALPEDCTTGYATSRTCEIGLSHHSGRPYRSIAVLLDRVSREGSSEGRG